MAEHSTADREVTGSTPVAPCLFETGCGFSFDEGKSLSVGIL